MLTRRTVLAGAAALLAAPMYRAAASGKGGAYDSALVYLTPLHRSGKESTCHAEVWFVYFEGAFYVVTASDAWRARAVRAGLDRARLSQRSASRSTGRPAAGRCAAYPRIGGVRKEVQP